MLSPTCVSLCMEGSPVEKPVGQSPNHWLFVIHKCIYIYIYTYLHVYIYIYIYVYTCITYNVYIYINIYIYMCIHIHIIYVYIYIYTYICVYMCRERERERERSIYHIYRSIYLSIWPVPAGWSTQITFARLFQLCGFGTVPVPS